MQGLTPEQVEELKLKDEGDKYYPSGGSQDCPDEVGMRTGQAPKPQLQDVLRRTVSEAQAALSKVGLWFPLSKAFVYAAFMLNIRKLCSSQSPLRYPAGAGGPQCAADW